MLDNYVCPNEDECGLEYKNCSWGFKGSNADNTKLLVIAHRPDDRVDNTRQPEPLLFGTDQNDHETEFRKSQTGKGIANLLQYSRLTANDICFTNIFWGTPPINQDPNRKQYRCCKPNWEGIIREFEPKAIILFGGKAYEKVFPIDARDASVEDQIGEYLQYKFIPTIIFNHPSKIRLAIKKERRSEFGQQLKEFLQKCEIIEA